MRWTRNAARTRYKADLDHKLVITAALRRGSRDELWDVVVFGDALYTPAKSLREAKQRGEAEARRRLTEALMRTSGTLGPVLR